MPVDRLEDRVWLQRHVELAQVVGFILALGEIVLDRYSSPLLAYSGFRALLAKTTDTWTCWQVWRLHQLFWKNRVLLRCRLGET